MNAQAANRFTTFEDILALARTAGECPEHRTKHSAVLEKAISGGFPALANKLVQGASAFAADGVLDEGELYSMALIVNDIIKYVSKAVEIGRTFVMPGFIVAERDGVVALCYSSSPCTQECWEACTICPKGHARFVPAKFHRALVEAYRFDGPNRTPRNEPARASL